MTSLGGSVDKEAACSAGNARLIPGSGRSPGGGNGSLLQYSCLENPMNRGAWQAIVPGPWGRKSWARLSNYTTNHHHKYIYINL